jgi:glycerophosphoryl diester phosphodiesterase
MLKFGHRGAAAYAPENTIESFEKALQIGVDYIELDVHLSNDNQLVVIHDYEVDRTTNGKGKVAEMNLEQIKSLVIAHRLTVPTLTEVFDYIDRRCKINVELKCFASATEVVKLIDLYVNQKDWQYDDFVISSFDWEALTQVHLLNNKLKIAVLTENNVRTALSFAKWIQAIAVNPNYQLLTKELTQEIQEAGFLVIPWTIDSQAAIALVKSYGVDGIFSDNPDLL